MASITEKKNRKPRLQQPPTVYCPSEQTDCLADFPRSVMMMGVVTPEACQSYGIHLALPALWGRSCHRSSLVAFVETKFQLSPCREGRWQYYVGSLFDSDRTTRARNGNTRWWELRFLLCMQKVNRVGLARPQVLFSIELTWHWMTDSFVHLVSLKVSSLRGHSPVLLPDFKIWL